MANQSRVGNSFGESKTPKLSQGRLWGAGLMGRSLLGLTLGVGMLASAAHAAPESGKTVSKAGQQTRNSATVVSSVQTSGGVYRSTFADGRIVFSDRPLVDATGLTVLAYGSGNEADAIAKRERDYWRERSEAFAERQRLREKEVEATRRAVMVAERSQSVQADEAVGTYTVYRHRGNGGQIQVNPVYQSSPGAVNGRNVYPLPVTPRR